ncbi:hypothetical protein ABVK25_005797 [Lepraria finkii]|uniref:Uncharacterized protein n=1 Tax=Lepraria finkii TaxID=1340010 RepID=A0ABR4B8V9_9LECA
MYHIITMMFFLAVFFPYDTVHAARLSHREFSRFTNGRLRMEAKALDARGQGVPYLNIVKGIFRSHHLTNDLSNVPCNIVHTLTTDAQAAEKFVQQIQAGQVPSLIQNLPEEAVSEIGDVIGIFTALPSEILNAAESLATDAVHVIDDIEDGSIVSDIEQIPGVIVSDVTAAWGDLTNGLENAWNDATSAIGCFFDPAPCASSTVANACPVSNSNAAATSYASVAPTYNTAAAASSSAAYASYTSETSYASALQASVSRAAATRQSAAQNGGQATTPSTTQSATQSTPQSGPQPVSMASSMFEWAKINALAITVIVVFGLALWL